MAQLAEQLICNQQVGGSSPSTSSNVRRNSLRFVSRWCGKLRIRSFLLPFQIKPASLGFDFSEERVLKLNMGEFPSGQRGQTVNLLAMPSVVRIHLPPPSRSKLYVACSDFFTKVRARSCRCSSFPNQTRSAGLRFGVGCRPENCGICSVLRLRKSASFERSLPIFTYSLFPKRLHFCLPRQECSLFIFQG